ncbi:type II toxin-antitoxin system RelE/ParE family toxin [Allomesorhizobium camelthorni]|uniref:Type II toxin-antitoxin system RelE/ParE family toxin n=1 Tax=Allomesorhizobium camelthorni TaxID=475069 RepID=A0A6G4WK83_9HYPH|nr:type II toxin-antitoxin system RelE/ParE family toxin [Mesorhizobium camelthorni]NGO54768.1 type II toxin-antitoxin system RelE/ParE family toxin [Mesorhizobium camelthorni]
MAAEVRWLDQAKDDLGEILDYIAAENPQAGGRYVAGLYAACDRLATFPMSGRRFNDEFRVLIFRNHLVFHQYDEAADIVSIVMVLDGRRDLSRFFEQTV